MLSLQNDPKKLALFNGLIESYVMRIKTWDKKDNKSRLNDFIDVIRAWDYHKSSVDDLNKELLEKGLWFEDDKFKEALCTINCYPNNNKRRTLTRYILLKLAFSYWTDFLSNYLTDAELIKKEKSKRYSQLWNMSRQRGNDRLQIEHIEPKNNSDQLFTPYLNKIGNLSLLDPLNNSTLNATPGNKKPYRKLTAEEMYNTTLPYLILFEDIDNFDHWEPADIQARSHRIVERAIKIWPDFAEIKRSLSENS